MLTKLNHFPSDQPDSPRLSEPMATSAKIRLDLGAQTFIAGGLEIFWLYPPTDREHSTKCFVCVFFWGVGVLFSFLVTVFVCCFLLRLFGMKWMEMDGGPLAKHGKHTRFD